MNEKSTYKVLPIKYRPSNFEEVVGQKYIVKILKKAIENNCLANSLLFSGPRGVGKTTCARIVAKMLNNINKSNELSKNNNEFNYNIIEIDAASNNSVEDIRSIIEQVRFFPSKGKYKIYIIDEIHMLSKSAFNAFLKTLEEPPSYIIFILITTEKYKIPNTIISRCQIYDFERISIDDIKMILKNISIKENINIENDVLNLISQKSDGILRDALLLFDKLICYNINNTNNIITNKNTINELGIIDIDIYFKITYYIINSDIYNTLLLFDNIFQKGIDVKSFINDLALHFRNLFISKNIKTISLLKFNHEICENYVNYSKKIDINFIIYILDLLKQIEINIRNSQNVRLSIEILLIKICSFYKIFDKNEKKKKF